MLKVERHKYIMGKLHENQKVSTINLALELNISEDTIRRDLIELNKKGLLEKVYGGAFPVIDKPANIFDITIVNRDKKDIIGNKALSLITDGQVIIMSGGTTNLAFAKLIPSDLKATIYTYSLPIAMQLSQHSNVELIFIGGKMQKNAMVTIGLDVVHVLSKLKADICFMGASSINVRLGLTEMGYEVSIVKKAMMKASDKVVTMVSSEKLNTKMPYVVSELNQLNTLITDLNPKNPILEEYIKAGVQVL
ncbi:DeoR/GlpR transcriptional regulator [Flavobacterium sp. GSP27]|uniref:DeoR/GlpR family DNA-binding transcription regulator n=1 Tax=unclassified Flavobacterium TaxID=196869 RepID=UPI000F81D887|nr:MULTISPECIES: DeoR/GlpR family DNA-binding transcription regulator [unclassified Flavobacterium]RTY84758.1 DeoR/GlpR transcriptional regulator [Flavobacterium sp. ZB4P23]RTY94039.1 DeoR/GlpR transcriptional regulator [Flavobacterium sp. GSN2]RTZ05894.1 DeoR/GlpR transcriptional regulator [Flavobacterium sp. GSP27]